MASNKQEILGVAPIFRLRREADRPFRSYQKQTRVDVEAVRLLCTHNSPNRFSTCNRSLGRQSV